MKLPDIIKNLYTNKSCDWIVDIPEESIQPFVIQKWLVMDDRLRAYVRVLDKYVFSITPKMYLSLAWSAIPKTPHAPFNKYIKTVDETEKYDFILSRIRKHFNLSDNDYACNKDRLLQAVKKDPVQWFKFYGIRKAYWQSEYIDYEKIAT